MHNPTVISVADTGSTQVLEQPNGFLWAHIAAFDGRFREQFRNESRSQIPLERQLARSSLSTTTTSGKAVHRGGSMTSSPVTSISDSHTGDRWTSSPLRRDVRGNFIG
ncbi:unnamed protein product [Haemonchus placei]|uniref:Hydantoinase_A domain-containing protein n=1 Tax=Haemonchus placei TaxID=6290 RepID=A0A0N4WZU9_HAEPC|nr:unnamed protein product [Haemonchus placei]